MSNDNLLEAVKRVKSLTEDRLTRYPQSSFFTFAERQILSIEEYLFSKGHFDRPFYEQLNIGVMCARELEQVDPDFCDSVYDMLEQIRLDTLNH